MIWWQLITRWGTENLFWLMMTGKIWAWDIPTKFVLHLMTAQQKWHRMFIPSDWLKCPKADSFFKKYCNWQWNMGAVTLKLNNHEWKTSSSSWSKKVNWVHCKTTMSPTAFSVNSRWYCAPWIYTSQGETVNEHFYIQVLRHLFDVVCHEQPWKLQSCAWEIHHNTLVH